MMRLLSYLIDLIGGPYRNRTYNLGIKSPTSSGISRTYGYFGGTIALCGLVYGTITAQCLAQDNIILILTDDQRADTLEFMPEVKRHLVDKGTTFANAFATTPECCPFRAALLNGGFQTHNTKVLTNTAPDGGVSRFNDAMTLGTMLQARGYRTAYIGKYLNEYETVAPYVPPGWNRFVVPLTGDKEELSGGDWAAYKAVVNGSLVDVSQYVTDYLRDEAIKFINNNIGRAPLFIVIATNAPHSPATPATQDLGLFMNYLPEIVPDDLSDKPQWVRDASPPDEDMTEFARNQLRSLQAVDRMVLALRDAMNSYNAMPTTRWVFTSDNGFMWGEHGLYHKSKPYDESLRVPLVIRGNAFGLAPRVNTDMVQVAQDLGQTILAWAGSGITTDGKDLSPCASGVNNCIKNRGGLLIQHFDTLSKRRADIWAGYMTKEYKYVFYPRTDEVELYDRVNDPKELTNIAGPQYQSIMDEYRAKVDLKAGLVVKENEAPTGKVGEPYSFQMTFLWGTPPYTAVIHSGALPSGLSLSQSGTISGVPSQAGTKTVTIKAKDSSATPVHGFPQNFWQKFKITIN